MTVNWKRVEISPILIIWVYLKGDTTRSGIFTRGDQFVRSLLFCVKNHIVRLSKKSEVKEFHLLVRISCCSTVMIPGAKQWSFFSPLTSSNMGWLLWVINGIQGESRMYVFNLRPSHPPREGNPPQYIRYAPLCPYISSFCTSKVRHMCPH